MESTAGRFVNGLLDTISDIEKATSKQHTNNFNTRKTFAYELVEGGTQKAYLWFYAGKFQINNKKVSDFMHSECVAVDGHAFAAALCELVSYIYNDIKSINIETIENWIKINSAVLALGIQRMSFDINKKA